LAFGQVRNALGLPVSLLILAGCFGAGLVLLRFVDERAGIAAAEAEGAGPGATPTGSVPGA